MQNMNYFLIDDGDHDIIVHGPSGIRLYVYNLELHDFRPEPHELHVFGDDHGEWLAFETEGWRDGGFEIMGNAVMWYAMYLGYPAMEITTDDPRPGFRLKKVE